jgi:hypothetical protein
MLFSRGIVVFETLVEENALPSILASFSTLKDV